MKPPRSLMADIHDVARDRSGRQCPADRTKRMARKCVTSKSANVKKLIIVLLCAALGGCFTPENRVHPAVKDLGLRVFVWVNFILRRLERQAGRGFARFSSVEKSGMLFRWLLHANASVCPTHTASTASALWRSCAASSAIRLHASSHLSGAKKNALQGMCSSMSGLRPQASSCERFAQWRLQNLSGPRSASGPMSMR